jgi:outer membrane autotransporter protein
MNDSKQNHRRGKGSPVLACIALAGLGTSASVQAQTAPIDALTRFINSQSQRAIAVAVGTLCPAGNRLSARLQQDCNALVGSAFQNDGAVAAALRQIVPDNVSASLDRSQFQRGGAGFGGIGIGAGVFGPQLGFTAEDGVGTLSFLPDLSAGSYAASGEYGRWSVFANLDFADYEREASLNEDGFDADRQALTVGLDRRFSDRFNAGIALALARDDLEFSSGSGEQDVDEQRLMAYASWNGASGFYFDALASLQQRDVGQERRVAYSLANGTSVDQRFRADYDADITSLGFTLGRRWQRESVGWDPYLGIEFASLDVDGYTERASAPDANGAGWAIVAPDVDSDLTTATLGLRVDWAISGANGVWLPQFDLAWVQVLDQDEPDTPVTLAGDLSVARQLEVFRFAMVNDEEDDSYLRAGFGLVGQWADGRSGFVNLARQFGNGRYDQTELTLGLRWEF